jgi:antitoxin FitA
LVYNPGEARFEEIPAVSELVLTQLDDAILDHLRDRASRHGRTAVEEAKVILSEVLGVRPAGPWARVDTIYERLAASGRTFTDSVDLLREDRDR